MNRAIVAITIEPDNHHSAEACPYCNPKGLKLGVAAVAEPVEASVREKEIADWDAKLAELYKWTGSEYVEEMPDLYSFLCSLIGYLLCGRDAAIAALQPDGEVERLREALRKILDFSDLEMGDGDGAREVARAALRLPLVEE